MNKLLLVCMLLLGLNGFSQYGTLLLSDLDDPAHPLEGVSVYSGTQLLGKTDYVGAFRFSQKFKGPITLSYPGYETRTLSVKTKEGWTQDVFLSVTRDIYDARKAEESAILYAKCLPDSLPVVPLGTGNPASSQSFETYLGYKRYPQRAIENREAGTVEIAFLIDTAGNVSCVEVLKSAGFELDKEAVRMIKATSGWTPAKKNGVAVPAVYKAEVPFSLPEKKKR
jgi:TonB family protein